MNPKPYFADLFHRSRKDRITLYGEAARMGISADIVHQMLMGSAIPVPVHYAFCMLALVSEWNNSDYQLEDTAITITSVTFKDLYVFHHFSLYALSTDASVTRELLEDMLEGKPVGSWSAQNAIAAIAQMTGRPYSLENVNVPVFSEEEEENI